MFNLFSESFLVYLNNLLPAVWSGRKVRVLGHVHSCVGSDGAMLGVLPESQRLPLHHFVRTLQR